MEHHIPYILCEGTVGFLQKEFSIFSCCSYCDLFILTKSTSLKIIEENVRREKREEYFSFNLEDKGIAGCNG